MAAHKYFIGDAINKPAVHHESFEKLWETKWKAPVCLGTEIPARTTTVPLTPPVRNGDLPLHVRQHPRL